MAKASGTTRVKYASSGLPTGTHFRKISVDGVRQGMIELAGRKIVMVNMNGVDVPFYLSTGKGRKYEVESGKWYPFFGIDPDGWFNKGTQTQINNYYGSSELKRVSEALDKKWGDIRGTDKGKTVVKNRKSNPEQWDSVRRQINKDVKGPLQKHPVSGSYIDFSEQRLSSNNDATAFNARIEEVKRKIKRR